MVDAEPGLILPLRETKLERYLNPTPFNTEFNFYYVQKNPNQILYTTRRTQGRYGLGDRSKLPSFPSFWGQ